MVYHYMYSIDVEYGGECTTDAECDATVLHSVCNEDTPSICDCDGLQLFDNPSGPSCCYTDAWGEECAVNADCLCKIL